MTLRIRNATSEDSPAILKLLANNSQPGRVHLAFERSPDYFHGAGISSEHPDVYVVEHPHEDALIGLFNLGHRSLYINGERQRIRYAHDLRLDSAFRGGETLVQMYGTLRDLLRDDEWIQSVVLAENARFLRSLSQTRPDLPRFYPYGEIETSLIHGKPFGRRSLAGLEIRPASRADLPLMQAFMDREGPGKQFFPCYRLQELAEGRPFYRGLSLEDYWLVLDQGCVAGMAGVWDQHGFKQTRVVSYSRTVALTRPLYNIHSRVRGGLKLPSRGQCFHYLNLHNVLVRDNDADLFALLLQQLYEHYRHRYDALICGFFSQDPLARVPLRYRRRVLRSRQLLGTYGSDPRPGLEPARIPFADVARL